MSRVQEAAALSAASCRRQLQRWSSKSCRRQLQVRQLQVEGSRVEQRGRAAEEERSCGEGQQADVEAEELRWKQRSRRGAAVEGSRAEELW